MKKIVGCAYNMDTGCVELRYADGSVYAIRKLNKRREGTA